MPLSKEQIKALLKHVVRAEEDSIDCDGCYGQVAEFSEAQLEGAEIPQALEAVEVHLRQCGCCNDEFIGRPLVIGGSFAGDVFRPPACKNPLFSQAVNSIPNAIEDRSAFLFRKIAV